MRRTCHLLARCYPKAWRKRYGAEFLDLLSEIQQPTLRDAADIARHVVTAWAATALASSRFAVVVAACFCVLGIINSLAASPDGYRLWQGSALFLASAVFLMPLSAVTGFLASHHRPGLVTGARSGLLLALGSLALPALLLLFFCLRFEASAPHMTLPVEMQNWQRSREWFEHWDRTVRLSWLFSTLGCTLLGALGGGTRRAWHWLRTSSAP